jgi:hypothetical protein
LSPGSPRASVFFVVVPPARRRWHTLEDHDVLDVLEIAPGVEGCGRGPATGGESQGLASESQHPPSVALDDDVPALAAASRQELEPEVVGDQAL